MSENLIKLCRFCLFEEKSDNANEILDIFQNELNSTLAGKIINYTQIAISPTDEIPPKICMKCINTIMEFDNFLTCCWKSDKALREMFNLPSQTIVNSSEQSSSGKSKEHVIETTVADDKTSLHTDNDRHNSTKTDETLSDDMTDDTDSDDSIDKNYEESIKKSGNTKHVKVNQTVKKIIGDNVYVCNICSKEFTTFFEYQDHQETHNGQLVFSCTKCDKVFSERQTLLEHDANHKVACQVCNKMVLPKSLPAHLNKHTDLFGCSECSLSHTSKAALENHIKARHTGQKGLVCHICGKQSSCQSSLNRHLAYHSSVRPFQCTYCNFSTKSQTILKVHISRQHLGKQMSCQECGKTFKSEISLKQHIKRIHNPRKYSCHICQKSFIEKYNLDRHILKKHSNKSSYDCRVCRKEFHTMKDLKGHTYSHKQGTVSCPNCGKQFFYKKYLEKHMAKCMPDPQEENCRDKLHRLQSTISLPSSMQLEKLQNFNGDTL